MMQATPTLSPSPSPTPADAAAVVATTAPGPVGSLLDWAWLYILAIILVAAIPMLLDMALAYWFANSTRRLLIAQAAQNGLTAQELRLVLTELSSSPPGIPGLARSTMALTVIVVLGIAIVHLLISPGTLGANAPQIMNNVLTLLSGLLAAITGFYFGGRAA